MSKIISFQGVDGAYSQLAVKDFFSGAETLPCKTFEIALSEAAISCSLSCQDRTRLPRFGVPIL